MINCDECSVSITTGHKIFKSKVQANYDICQACFEKLAKESMVEAGIESDEESKSDSLDTVNFMRSPFANSFYIIENGTDEDILHEYH